MRILVTGATGTFGRAFIRYALDRGDSIIGLSRGEHKQAELRAEMQADKRRLDLWIGDVRDRERIRWAMRAKPDVVIHAAALKRVEVCDDQPSEAIKTNIDGTRNVVEEAMLADVPKVLVISSDKATSPETVYGTTKAAAEAAAIAQNGWRGNGKTRISVVRYGNVLGSQGSFLNTLMRARQTGEAISITHPDCTRYWWSIDDAVVFVASVLEQMRGAEIWVPKLASSKVVDLAKAVAPESEMQIVGMRGPEKLHESMISATESAYCYELSDRYVLLPKRGEWWSAEPPVGSIPVQQGFTYASNHQPMSVSVHESREDTCGSQSLAAAQ